MSDLPASVEDRCLGALIGSAAGDALGWPFEDRSGRVDGQGESLRDPTHRNGFLKWTRRTGSRFWAHLEPIEVGEYSDDTQLTLCVARSLLRGGAKWWDLLTQIELPTWNVYERGGGRATKAATGEWAKSNAPWNSEKREPYWKAGGNGVAMRVLPHVLFHGPSDDFRRIAETVFADGISTHGHPRALVGALAQAYGLWVSLHRTETLEYGRLIDDVADGVGEWAFLPDDVPFVSRFGEWREEADWAVGEGYAALWDKTVGEMQELLGRAKSGMKQGALSVDQEALEDLEAVRSKVKGAGTISAAGAVFIASRYAADPYAGLMTAARMPDADTDTLAAMAGSILGAIRGTEWLGSLPDELQDIGYLIDLGQALRDADGFTEGPDNISSPSQSALRGFTSEVGDAEAGDGVTLPDGRSGTIREIGPLERITQSALVVRAAIELNDGQTIYVKSFTRLNGQQPKQPKSTQQEHADEEDASPAVRRIGFQLLVNDLHRSRRFYEETLGLPVTKERRGALTFAGVLTIHQSNDLARQLSFGHEFVHGRGFKLFVELEDAEEVFQRIEASDTPIISDKGRRGNRVYFRCVDPDGNLVDVFGVPEASDGAKIDGYAPPRLDL